MVKKCFCDVCDDSEKSRFLVIFGPFWALWGLGDQWDWCKMVLLNAKMLLLDVFRSI